MERIVDTNTASSVRFLRTTPKALRELATRLEVQAREATLPGELVVYPVTRSLSLVYDPEVGLAQWKRQADHTPAMLPGDVDEPHPDSTIGT